MSLLQNYLQRYEDLELSKIMSPYLEILVDFESSGDPRHARKFYNYTHISKKMIYTLCKMGFISTPDANVLDKILACSRIVASNLDFEMTKLNRVVHYG